MIIDGHTHIFEAGRGGPLDLPCSADDLVRAMDSAGIDLSIVIPLPGVASNDFVHRECARFPDRLRAIYTPEFEDPSGTIAKLERFFGQWQPRGLKIHPRVQHVTASDSIVRETLSWAETRCLPVIFDVFPFGAELDILALQPLAYHPIAQNCRQLKIVLAHAGGYRLMEAFMVAKSNPNVYLDISFTPLYFQGSSLLNDCGFLCRRLPPGRVLYGSDFPHTQMGDSLTLARQLLAETSESVVGEVLGGAAARLFGNGDKL